MNLADHFAQIMFWILLDENTPTSLARIAQQAANYHFKKKSEIRPKKKIFKGIATGLDGITINMTCSPQYAKWFEQLRPEWPPIIPKIDIDLASSP